MSKPNKPRLGRGLSSLMSLSEPQVAEQGETLASGDDPTSLPPERVESLAPEPAGPRVIDLSVEDIRPNPHQPRRDFNEASIAELATSLKSTGLIQPIIVRQVASGYELIAGERRLRAAKVAGLQTLPAIVKEVDGFTQAQMALVENIQREDLNPIDRANAYRVLLEQLGLTVSELAGRLGEDRSSVSNFLRLLELAEPVRDLLRGGKLSMGHAKLLAGLTDPVEQQTKAELVVAQGLSVRNLENIILSGPVSKPTAKPAGKKASNHLVDLEKSISRQLGTRVQVKASAQKGRGKLILFYADLDQFDQLMGRLGVVTEE